MALDINFDKTSGHFYKNGIEVIKLNMNLERLGLNPCIAIRSPGGAVKILPDACLEPEFRKECNAIFKNFDKDEDGKLSRDEFKSCLQSLGYDFPDQEFQTIFDTADTNKYVLTDFY